MFSIFALSVGLRLTADGLKAHGWVPVTEGHIQNGYLRRELNPVLRDFWRHQDVILWRDLQATDASRFTYRGVAVSKHSVVARFDFS